jgi:hypothetical protein
MPVSNTAWVKTTGAKGYLVASCTVTLSGTTDADTAVIDFIPPGRDWILRLNTAGTALSGANDIDILCSDTATGTFTVLKADLASNVASAAWPSTTWYVAATNGEAPFYKVRFDPDSANSAQSPVVQIIVPPES